MSDKKTCGKCTRASFKECRRSHPECHAAGGPFCWTHCEDEDTARKRLAAQRKGGYVAGGNADMADAIDMQEMDFDEPPGELETPEDVSHWLTWLAMGTALGEIPRTVANDLRKILKAKQELIERVELADRLRAVEEQLGTD